MATLFSVFGFRILLFMDIRSHPTTSKILILGTGKKALELQNELSSRERQGSFNEPANKIAGFVKIPDTDSHALLQQNQVVEIEEPGFIKGYALKNGVKEIVIALDERRKRLPIDDLMDCKLNGIKITDIADYLERENGCIELENFRPNNLIFSDGAAQMIRLKTKRLLDTLGSLFILTATLPIMVVTAILIFIESGFKGSVIYKQVRVGLNGQPFEIFKFRSMVENAEKGGKAIWAQQNDVRVTSTGKFIRKTRIDELPQLYNILKGDMSLVGPRPERPQFVDELAGVIPYYNLRHSAMPGLTGWAQTCYPYGASIDDSRKKLEYDLYYIKNYSVFLDLLILFQTAAVVIWGKGAR
ncbi:MAG: TIGR03013 family PEP-CTERM/XrtA system glycosyltransferase [Gammaproteobacteria bacterium]|nr:TIGR03013 family PEP-CTERM/XrtA system glycosyltransferase [Gammaproteobacteria bacterium]